MDAPVKSITTLMSLRGKTALVTGAAGSMGQAITLRLAETGTTLLLADKDKRGLIALREMLRVEHPKVQVELFTTDLTSDRDMQRLWHSLNRREPDILINNVGAYTPREFTKSDEAFDREVLAINLQSVTTMCREMLRSRGSRGGTIVNISSAEAILPSKDTLVQYSVSKAGVLALSRSLARDYGHRGWKVNVVVPGGIRSGTSGATRTLLRQGLGVVRETWPLAGYLPVRRIGEPDDVARAVLFLSSDMSDYINGAVITVDGGWLGGLV